MQKDEILYVSDTFKQSNEFLNDLTESLTELEIRFKLNGKNLSIETEKYKLKCLPINSFQLGISHHLVKYFMNCTCLSKIHFHIMIGCRLKEDVKEIKLRNDLIDLLSEKNLRYKYGRRI